MRNLRSAFVLAFVFGMWLGLCGRCSAQYTRPPADCSHPIEYLITSLKSKDVDARVNAALCLGKSGDRRAAAPLVSALFAEEYPRFIQIYEESLRDLDDPQTADLLLAALDSPKTRWQAAWSLGRLQIERGVEPLLQLLNSGDYQERRIAADSLGPMKDARALAPLSAALKDKDEVVRRYAADGLGKMGDGRAVDALIASLLDSDDGVRWNAANSLGDLHNSRAVMPLARALGDDEVDVQRAAADALGKIRDPQATKALALAMKSGSRVVRWQSAAALAEIGGPDAEEALVGSLNDGNLVAVAGGYRFFIRKGSTASIPILIQALNQSHDESMAQDLRFCGNSWLEDAAREWAVKNEKDDWEVGDSPLTWGSER